MPAVQETIDRVRQIDVDQYKYGFETLIESDKAPKGLNEDIIRFISAKKDEPEWMLEWRLGAYRRWLTMDEPTWARVDYPKIDFQDIHYYSAPKSSAGPKSIDEVDGVPEANEMTRLLVLGHEAVVRTARSVFPDAEEANDQASLDLLTRRIEVHEKTAWMLRSMLA